MVNDESDTKELTAEEKARLAYQKRLNNNTWIGLYSGKGKTPKETKLPKSDGSYLNERVTQLTKTNEPPKKTGEAPAYKEKVPEGELVYTQPVPNEIVTETAAKSNAIQTTKGTTVFVSEGETVDTHGNPVRDDATKEKLIKENTYTKHGQDKKSCEPLPKDPKFIRLGSREDFLLKYMLKELGIDEKECTEKPREPDEILMNENDIDVMRKEITISRIMKAYMQKAKHVNSAYRIMKALKEQYSGIEALLEMSGNAFEDFSKMEGASMDYAAAEKKIEDTVKSLDAILNVYAHKKKINSAFVSKLNKKIYDKIGTKTDDELRKLSEYIVERSKLDKDKNFDLYKTAENKIESIVGHEKMNDDVLNCVYNLLVAKEEFEKSNLDAKNMPLDKSRRVAGSDSHNKYSSYSAVFEGLKDYIRAVSNNGHSEDFAELQKLIVADERLISTIKANGWYSGVLNSHVELQKKEIYDQINSACGIEYISRDS